MKPSVSLVAAFGAAAILLTGCTGSLQNASAGLPIAGTESSVQRNFAIASHRLHLTGSEHVVYVADVYNPGVKVFKYGTWQYLGTISVSRPVFSLWVDKQHNLYAGTDHGVSEYDSSGNLIYSYSIRAEIDGVVTDRRGRVYVYGYGPSSTNFIEEFAPQSTEVLAECPFTASGFAVGRQGGVFAIPITGGNLTLFPGGLGAAYGCLSVKEPISSFRTLSIALDPQGNLLVPQSNYRMVDVIAPPYTSITGTMGVGQFPEGISINRAGTRAYIVDRQLGVLVLSYPSGSQIAVLDTSGSIPSPLAAVDSNNYVP